MNAAEDEPPVPSADEAADLVPEPESTVSSEAPTPHAQRPQTEPAKPSSAAPKDGEGAEARHRPGNSDDRERLEGYADGQAARQEGQTIINGSLSSHGQTVLGDGPSLFIERLITAAGGRESRVLDGHLSEERVHREQRTYEKVAGYDNLKATLSSAHIAEVVGEPGQGRRTTAKNVLADLVGTNSLHVLIVEQGVSLADIYEDAAKLLTDDNGYLLDLRDQTATPDVIEALHRKLVDRPVYLVIVRNDSASGDGRAGPYTFPHPAPQPRAVLCKHLQVLVEDHLPKCDGTCTTDRMAEYLDTCLTDENFLQQLNFKPPPRVMVQFAEVLTTGMHAEEDPEALLGRLPNRLRDAVEKALREPEVQPDEPHRAPQRQAVLISFAVFHSRPLTDVFETSSLLCQQILRFETRQAVSNQAVFDSNLKQLIGDEMCDTTLLREDDAPRRAQFVTPALSGIVLDVAWHDFASTRGPILTWLDALAGHDRVAIQVRAAQVAGLLAMYDFDEIYRKLIGSWARSHAKYRDSAALALEMASFDERLLSRTRDRVRDWAASPAPRLQDSAARAYGTRIGAAIPYDALGALHKLARKAELSESNAIAVALARLFAANAREPVLDTLREWIVSEVGYVRRHAVRALLLLARFSMSANQPAPALPGLLAEHNHWQDPLVKLWRGALISPETSTRAWESLRRWLVSAESNEELTVVEPLALHIFREPLACRAMFYLSMWVARSSEFAVLQRLYKAIRYNRP